MNINLKYIKTLTPCASRLQNYIDHYDEFSGSMTKFLNLKHLTHSDKLWVFLRSIPREKLALVAADFADAVLHVYEDAYPNDDRPRKAIEAARTGVNAADVANAATNIVYATTNATSAATYAATYATYAANAATYATYAANYDANATTADGYADHGAAVRAAGYTASAAAQAAPNQEAVQVKIMKRYAKEYLCKKSSMKSRPNLNPQPPVTQGSTPPTKATRSFWRR